jgi:glyoxylase-like metal-dependent hydrolase (beta-lactamase superfamily II)
MIKITDTIYRAENPGTPGLHAQSWVFINDDNVLVTDSGGSPLNARSMLAGVQSITSKPVKYLVDTHFHIDHAYGNTGVPPSVVVIGHESTRKYFLGPDSEARTGSTVEMVRMQLRDRIASLTAQLARQDPQGQADLQRQLEKAHADLQTYTGDFPLAVPDVTIADTTMSIWSGDKEIRLFWAGRGHTESDIIIYVPSEHAAATGDIVAKGNIGVQNDSFPNEWPAEIQKILDLDLDILMPAHGPHVVGKPGIREVLTNAQAFLREEWRQVSEQKKQGLTQEQALANVDMSAFKPAYGERAVANPYVVSRIYDIIDGKIPVN